MRVRDKEVIYILVIGAALFFCFIFASCATVYPHSALVDQIVAYRPNHSGLTHQVCSKYDWKQDCLNMDLIDYDMQDAATRKRFVDNGFVCSIGGRRFKIDPDNPRFVRYKQNKNCFLFICTNGDTVINEWILASDTQKLLDGHTRCYSERTYPGGLAE